ncbi:diphosphomevalonate decarboxylase [Shimia sp. R11_0]|uniref:diphosphomevalonate decarboxylase n=1 Tax=Shimia sp. R11_0 TaxID=2821096 RepID=UPI001ADA7EEE|nr:diphosphomevalonate decarboxylase [Shimia sp. R11_0]MBO9476296.1 diphosphomevalonate decarboxylase [Shimia sp. R11_0]
MSDAAKQLIGTAMTSAGVPKPFAAYAPSNIALSKYWGKRDHARNLPLNSSLSISLADWGSHTQVSPSDDGQDHVTLGGKELALDTPFAAKALRFADLFRTHAASAPLRIDTNNTIPTAAGLASSASGFAALTRALCGCFGLTDTLSEAQMSLIARLGSGSATRSFWHGFVRWDKGTRDDGADSFAHPLDLHWPEFHIAILPVDVGPKSQSSRDGMNHTVVTSPLFKSWPDQAEADCAAIETAIKEQDFETLGPLVEANALAMHATMQAARPALTYLTSESWTLLERLWRARQDGLRAFATMDAGANIKLIFLKQAATDVMQIFPQAQMIDPFSKP